LRYVASSGEEGETMKVAEMWLLSLTYMGTVVRLVGFRKLELPDLLLPPCRPGQLPGQSTRLAGSRHWAPWQSLAAMPSAFPFFFPAQFPLNASPMANAAADEASSSIWVT